MTEPLRDVKLVEAQAKTLWEREGTRKLVGLCELNLAVKRSGFTYQLEKPPTQESLMMAEGKSERGENQESVRCKRQELSCRGQCTKRPPHAAVRIIDMCMKARLIDRLATIRSVHTATEPHLHKPHLSFAGVTYAFRLVIHATQNLPICISDFQQTTLSRPSPASNDQPCHLIEPSYCLHHYEWTAP